MSTLQGGSGSRGHRVDAEGAAGNQVVAVPEPAIRSGTAVRRITPTERERLQALPDGWTYPHGPSLADVPMGAFLDAPEDVPPDGARESATGDAVTASVAEWIGRRLRARVESEAAAYDLIERDDD